ncbi:MAG: glycosyltransferase family 39 protein [Chloroflexota bacterium]
MADQGDRPTLTSTPQPTISDRLWLVGIVAVAVLLRLIFILIIDLKPNFAGGDVAFYLRYGLELVKNSSPPLAPGPGYLVYVGLIQLFIPTATVETNTAILVIRLLNIIWHVLLILAVYSLGKRYFTIGVARLAALVIAISPAFIIEAGTPVTESVFIALLFATLAIYAAYQDNPNWRIMLVVGVLLGIAALTRAQLLLFPVLLMAQLIRLHGWRQGLRFAAVLIVAYSLTLSTWTIYNWFKWDRVVVGAEGIAGTAWMGLYGPQSPQAVDKALGNGVLEGKGNELFIEQVLQKLQSDLPNYIKIRFANISTAYLQPHNTPYFPGDSLKDAAAQWFTTDRSLNGLLALTHGDYFWPKLLLYCFHLWAVIMGWIGLVLCWRRFWILLPIAGYILYTTAVHSVLLALPRYLFPIQPALILFAGCMTLELVRVLRRDRNNQVLWRRLGATN